MGYSHTVDHDTGTPDNPDEVPGRHITINQLVGFNIARWRKAAGLTQAELGEMLGGWSNATVSAAEKSWDGRRIRQFSADEMVAIALALEVPLAALLLPPDDDGAAVRYLFHAHEHGAGCSDMASLFSILFPESAGSSPAEGEWQAALGAAVNRYMDPDRGADYITYLEDLTSTERRTERLRRLRAHRAAMLAVLADLDQMAGAIETAEHGR